jgi:hypothetical protein
MLGLSIALAGFPAQAMPACPMMKMQQMQQTAADDGKGQDCHMAAKVKSNKCCDDQACDAKCSALSGGISIDLPTMRSALSVRDGQSLRLPAVTGSLASHLLDTQDRPPRILA